MSSGRGSNGGEGIPPASKKMVQSLKEIVGGVTEAEIYSTLKDCSMDPNEAVNRLLAQDHFHEVKSKREKKKVKSTTESRPRGGSSTLNRGARSGHNAPNYYNSSESSGFQNTNKKENGNNSITNSSTSASKVAPRNTNWQPPTYNDSFGYENEPTIAAIDGASFSQPSSGYQPAWLVGPGQKSMAEIVKMGRPNPPQQSINHNIVPEKHPEYNHVSFDNDWPLTDQPQPQAEFGFTSSQSNYQTNELVDHETDEVEGQDESSDEDEIENHVGPDNGPYEHNEEVDASFQKLSVQEEEHIVQPSLIIPSHLQVNTSDCSHLSFGSFGANINININPGFSRPSSVDQSETTNLEYYDDGPTRNITGAENYEQASVLKQEDPEVTRGGQSQSQSQYGFPSPSHSHTFEVARESQSQLSTPFLNDMGAENGNPVRESDLAYSQFSVSQSMPTRYANSASSISDPTMSMAEALKNVGLSSSQPPHQPLATGPAGPQHLTMHHPYSQHTLPLGLFSNMIGYPFLPQNYTYMPSGFQPGFAGNNTYHQQLAAMLPQYKNSVSVSSLPQSPAVASSYGGSYQNNQTVGPTGSTLSYDDVLSAHYKDNSHLLSLQQNEWVHGGGSRTMPAVPASAYYNLQQLQNQNQNQNHNQPSGFRQGQQPSQGYGGSVRNYPDVFQSQEHQLQQNPRDGGSQGQPKLQSQQLWQNGY